MAAALNLVRLDAWFNDEALDPGGPRVRSELARRGLIHARFPAGYRR
jgi:hypothetical protein